MEKERRMYDQQMKAIEVTIAEGFSKADIHRELHMERLDKMDEMQTKILECIYGNGKKGLITNITELQVMQKVILAFAGTVFTTAIALMGYLVF